MKKMSIVGTMGALLLSAAACSVNAPDSTGRTDADEGIPSLGIARVEITDNAQETTVVGYAEETNEVVARMTLVHGTFALTGAFREEYATAEVDGRKLDVEVLGQKLSWETAGYTPTLHMPAHPASQASLATFLDAPQVKPILEHWLIGFDGAREDGEAAYTTGSYTGTNLVNCNGLSSCLSVHGVTINTCGNSAAAIYATKGDTSANEQKLAQCCPANSGNLSYPWFATKTCPITTLGNCDPDGAGPKTTADGTSSACGCVLNTSACKGCATYPTYFGCTVSSDFGTTINYSFPDAFTLSFTGFTLSNGAGGAYTSVVGGYPDDISAVYGTNNTDSGLYRTDIGITVTARAFIGSNVVFINGACSSAGVGSTQCTIPAGAGNKSYSVRTSPF